MKVVFGIDVADDGDEIMAIVEDALEWIGETFTPGKYLIDALPILQCPRLVSGRNSSKTYREMEGYCGAVEGGTLS